MQYHEVIFTEEILICHTLIQKLHSLSSVTNTHFKNKMFMM